MLTILNIAYPFAPVTPSTAGGAEQVLLTLDHLLIENGHRSLVIAHEKSEVYGQLFGMSIPEGVIDDSMREAVHNRYRSIIAQTMVQHAIDVVHMHGIDFDHYLPTTPPPVLVTLHLPIPWYSKGMLERLLPPVYVNCVSSSQQQSCPHLPTLLPFVQNGVSEELFTISEPRSEFALMLGRICPEKGIHNGLEAARRAGMIAILAGQVFPYPEHLRYFESMIRPRIDQSDVRYIGSVGGQEKLRLLASAHCLLIPSSAPETSSLVAMEALACGTPVIAYGNGALPDIVEHDVTGFIVHDVNEMASAIKAVKYLDRKRCRASAHERFSSSRMFREYLDLYQYTIDQHTRLLTESPWHRVCEF